MSRPKTITDEQLLNAARKIFLTEGYSASTVGIAREAGVSEGTIFKRFPTKAAFFRAAMGLPTCHALDGLDERAGKLNVQENMAWLARGLLAFFRELIPRVMAMASTGAMANIQAHLREEGSPLRSVLDGLRQYFMVEMEAGRICKRDPMVLAQTVIGTLHNHVFLETMGISTEHQRCDDTFIDEWIAILWEGLGPDGGQS
jgi:AcrR family transcriptional regulator